jgi:F-type H+-transporting ATPase subunit b
MELVKPEFGLLFWMFVTFFIVLFLMKKFAWGPILKMIHEREETIENALNEAQKARQEIADMQSSNEKLLQEARMERDKILKEAREIRESMLNESKAKATAEYEKILATAKADIQTEKMAAINEMKNQVAVLSLEIAEKILRSELASDQKQKDLVTKLASDIKLN